MQLSTLLILATKIFALQTNMYTHHVKILFILLKCMIGIAELHGHQYKITENLKLLQDYIGHLIADQPRILKEVHTI